MIEILNGLEYPQELEAWLDLAIKESYDGISVDINDKIRLKQLYVLWVNDDAEDGCEGLRENLEVLELLDAHIRFNNHKLVITDKERLRTLYLLIKDGDMRLLQYRLDDI